MFERFTDRARRVVVLAQEEAKMLNHNYIGTEHILLGLIHEGEGVAAKALESLDISLEAVRAQVEEIIGQGQQAPSGHIPFTPRAKKVLELSLRDADIAPGGRLDPQWRALLERHSDRFLLGTDTWTPSRWDLVGVNAESARRWLKQLTPAQASAIAYRNADRLFPPSRPGAAAKNSHGQT